MKIRIRTSIPIAFKRKDNGAILVKSSRRDRYYYGPADPTDKFTTRMIEGTNLQSRLKETLIFPLHISSEELLEELKKDPEYRKHLPNKHWKI